MTAKPESVESVVALLDGLTYSFDGRANMVKLRDRILAAHRAEMAEALKEPTHDELRELLTTGRLSEQPISSRLLASRRRKHGVDK